MNPPTSGRCARRFAVLVMLLGVLQGCSEGTADDALPASFIRVDIDKSEPKRLLTYYFGGYLRPTPADPFEAGLLADTLGRLFLNIDSLAAHHPAAASTLTDGNGDNRVDWEEFESFIDATYYDARGLPRTIDSLLNRAAYTENDPNWMHVELNGVMTTARRRLAIDKASIRHALATYWENGERLIYPVGTTIIGTHLRNDSLAETTVMRKREDGFWDFAVYDAGDSLSSKTLTPPRELKSPVQCVGCHFGSKLFEPEKSFPARSEPGPHGPRQIYVSDELRDPDVVRLFDEHRKRSDTILGLYSTLFVAELRKQHRDGTAAEEDAALLENLGL